VEYAEAGAGPPLLYFHGTGVLGEAMLEVERSIIDDGFRLIVPNRPGYGRTPLGSDKSAAGCANVATALLDALGIADAVVLGSSGGAAFATSFVLHHPTRARGLVLLCPQGHRWDHPRWLPKNSRWTLPLLRRRPLRRLLLWLHRIHLHRMTADQLLKLESGTRYQEVSSDPASRRISEITLAAMRQGTRCPGFENDFAVFVNEDIVGADDVVSTPTLIIHDEQDPLAPAGHVNWLVARCTSCERVSIRTAGHLVWAGPEADVMHRARIRFLKEHAAGT
jgi:pimeloyl-ACP methyl ester carboxylesterase